MPFPIIACHWQTTRRRRISKLVLSCSHLVFLCGLIKSNILKALIIGRAGRKNCQKSLQNIAAQPDSCWQESDSWQAARKKGPARICNYEIKTATAGPKIHDGLSKTKWMGFLSSGCTGIWTRWIGRRTMWADQPWAVALQYPVGCAGGSRSAQLLPACPATDGCGCTSSGTGAPPTAPPSCNITDKNTANNKKCNVSWPRPHPRHFIGLSSGSDSVDWVAWVAWVAWRQVVSHWNLLHYAQDAGLDVLARHCSLLSAAALDCQQKLFCCMSLLPEHFTGLSSDCNGWQKDTQL